MIDQRRPNGTQCVQGIVEQLPFRDGTFQVGTAIMTLHHWSDLEMAARELRRVVSSRMIFLTHFLDMREVFWLTEHYVPELDYFNDERHPSLATLERAIGRRYTSVEIVPIPADCTDGFFYAFWARPEVYLDPAARSSSSSMRELEAFPDRLGLLEDDLRSGRWMERYGALLAAQEIDLGCRLVTFDFED